MSDLGQAWSHSGPPGNAITCPQFVDQKILCLGAEARCVAGWACIRVRPDARRIVCGQGR